jgi:hypothetical protein
MWQRLGLSGSLTLGVCLMALPALAVPDTSVAAMSSNLATSIVRQATVLFVKHLA